MNENLSAFVDNELSEFEERRLLVELGHDPQLRATWERYHLIRAALRNELERLAPATLSGAVAEVVAREPLRRHWRTSATMLGKTVGGLAIAASVAAIAILSLQSPVTPRGETESVAQATAGGQAVRVATPVAARVPTAADALNAYLVEHSEFAPTAGLGNMLPYVRTVGHDSNR
jgi:sigma-E factor negative regulatory protein RseA